MVTKGNPKSSLALYQGLLIPAFVACSTNAGEGLVKLSHVQWRTWTCGGVACFFCTAVKQLSETSPRLSDVEYSVVLQSVFVIGSILAYLLGMCHSSTRPGMSLTWLSFTRPSPALVLQVANAGMRRPWYKAKSSLQCYLHGSQWAVTLIYAVDTGSWPCILRKGWSCYAFFCILFGQLGQNVWVVNCIWLMNEMQCSQVVQTMQSSSQAVKQQIWWPKILTNGQDCAHDYSIWAGVTTTICAREPEKGSWIIGTASRLA